MIHKQICSNNLPRVSLKKTHKLLTNLPNQFCKQDVEQLWMKCYGNCGDSTIYRYINFLTKVKKIKCINNTYHHKIYEKI